MQTAADLNSLQVCVYFSAAKKMGPVVSHSWPRLPVLIHASLSRYEEPVRSVLLGGGRQNVRFGKNPEIKSEYPISRMKTDRLTALSLRISLR